MGISKLVECDIKKRHPLKKLGMVQRRTIASYKRLALVFSTVPDGFYENVEKGSIILKRYPTFRFFEEGIVLDHSIKPTQPIKSDLVIFATGFKADQKLKDIFVSPIFQDYIFGSSNKTGYMAQWTMLNVKT